eukprot:18694-Heterococcus_DN1.PRE.1
MPPPDRSCSVPSSAVASERENTDPGRVVTLPIGCSVSSRSCKSQNRMILSWLPLASTALPSTLQLAKLRTAPLCACTAAGLSVCKPCTKVASSAKASACLMQCELCGGRHY